MGLGLRNLSAAWQGIELQCPKREGQRSWDRVNRSDTRLLLTNVKISLKRLVMQGPSKQNIRLLRSILSL